MQKFILAGTLLLATFGVVMLSNAGQEPAQPDLAQTEGVETLTTGPLHEAFAQPNLFNPQPGLIVAKQPPEPIEEMPPAEKPDGDDIVWIPGYWGWDVDRDDFIWISGFWRAAPPGRQWVSGYWNAAQNSFQWVSGFWASVGDTQIAYYTEPPESLEAGPTSGPPAPDNIWAPGIWVWNTNRYAWRPGFWVAPRNNWVYTPAQYFWTPSGYVFIDSYWDYSPARRGLLFAPVYFGRSLIRTFTPAVALLTNALVGNLFIRPGYHHYLFGDYYAANYVGAGVYPWFAFHSSRYGYDPIYAYYAWQNRGQAQWANRLQANYAARRDSKDLRPARTYQTQLALAKSGAIDADSGQLLGQSLKAAFAQSAWKSRTLDEATRNALVKQTQEVRQITKQRFQSEAATAKTGPQVAPLQLPKQPLLAAKARAGVGREAPPTAPKAPGLIQEDPKTPKKGSRHNPEDLIPGITAPAPKDVGKKSDVPKAEPPAKLPPMKPDVLQPPQNPQPKPPMAQPKPPAPADQPKIEPKVDDPKKKAESPPPVQPPIQPKPPVNPEPKTPSPPKAQPQPPQPPQVQPPQPKVQPPQTPKGNPGLPVPPKARPANPNKSV